MDTSWRSKIPTFQTLRVKKLVCPWNISEAKFRIKRLAYQLINLVVSGKKTVYRAKCTMSKKTRLKSCFIGKKPFLLRLMFNKSKNMVYRWNKVSVLFDLVSWSKKPVCRLIEHLSWYRVSQYKPYRDSAPICRTSVNVMQIMFTHLKTIVD